MNRLYQRLWIFFFKRAYRDRDLQPGVLLAEAMDMLSARCFGAGRILAGVMIIPDTDDNGYEIIELDEKDVDFYRSLSVE